jgi:hypothetical protein
MFRQTRNVLRPVPSTFSLWETKHVGGPGTGSVAYEPYYGGQDQRAGSSLPVTNVRADGDCVTPYFEAGEQGEDAI